MKVKRADMRYDRELERWVVEGRDAWFSMRCGEGITLHVGEHALGGRIEFGMNTWWIIANDVPLGLFRGRTYTVTIEI